MATSTRRCMRRSGAPGSYPVVMLAMISSLLLTSCSTSVWITTDPPNADVEINGQAMGKTPVTIELSDFDLNSYRMRLSKPGYADKTVTLQKELKAGQFIGGFFIWPFWLWCYGPMESYSYRLEPLQSPETKAVVQEEKSGELPEGTDIERDIPEAGSGNPDAVAVIIGITHYKNPDIPPVSYAVPGAALVKEYFEKSFGVDEKRIIYVTDQDASLSDFRKIFSEQLKNYVVAGRSDVYIYYQGHGVPDPESKEAYFVPYDCDPSYAKSTGYPLKEFYSNIAKLPARSVTVILDACFSGASAGGTLLKNISPLYIEAKSPAFTMNNAVIFASSTGEQVSCWYPEKKQSLFTYFFLKGLTRDADINGDGIITAGEMREYLSKNVPAEARYISNREQTPQLMTKDPSRTLLKYR